MSQKNTQYSKDNISYRDYCFSSDDEILDASAYPSQGIISEDDSSEHSEKPLADSTRLSLQTKRDLDETNVETFSVGKQLGISSNRIAPDESIILKKDTILSSDESGGHISSDESDILISSDEEEQHETVTSLPQDAAAVVKEVIDTPAKENTTEEAIALISGIDVTKKIIQNLKDNRIPNLTAEKKRLELQVMDLKTQLDNLQSASKNMDVEKLPDKGARMKDSITKKMNKIKSLYERISLIGKQIDKESVSKKDANTLAYINNLPTATMNLSELGKKALETFNVKRDLTVKTLEGLHDSLKNQPQDFSVEPKDGLKVSLLAHQKFALGWALWRESQKPAGGILADDMGLGKTLTMISLILHTVEDKTAYSERNATPRGGTLVIAPASVMGQWENEVKSKVKGRHLSCIIYHGPKRKNQRGLENYNIVLTTYSSAQREEEDSPLMKIRWSRIILDEAHTIRNAKCKTAQSIFNLKGKFRWALTGTPVQNKELDLYALLRFLKCKPFDDLSVWKQWIENKDAAGIQRLNCILKAILLRRTKQELQSQGQLESLSSRSADTININLDEEEYEIYKKVAYFSKHLLGQLIHQRAEKENLFENGVPVSNPRHYERNSNPFNGHPELGALYRDMMDMGNVKTHHILLLLLRLRQICCHPALAVSLLSDEEMNTSGIDQNEVATTDIVHRINRMSIAPENAELPEEASTDNVFQKSRCSSKMRAVIDKVMHILTETRDKLIVVSQWTSVLEILKVFLDQMNVDIVEFNGKIPIKERQPIIEKFNRETDPTQVMLLSLAAGGTGLNLIGANHLLLIDVHWNPQLEAQACDRIYRVGQKKKVFIYKFVCSNTIEENIVELQNRKLELAKGVLTGSMDSNVSKLTMNDLKMLFNVK